MTPIFRHAVRGRSVCASPLVSLLQRASRQNECKWRSDPAVCVRPTDSLAPAASFGRFSTAPAPLLAPEASPPPTHLRHRRSHQPRRAGGWKHGALPLLRKEQCSLMPMVTVHAVHCMLTHEDAAGAGRGTGCTNVFQQHSIRGNLSEAHSPRASCRAPRMARYVRDW